MNIILLAPPAAGKGTQAELLENKYHLNHISTGELLRKSASREDDFGKKMRNLLESGELVSDEIIFEVLNKHLETCRNQNLLLDGFPRNIYQAERLEEMLKENIPYRVVGSFYFYNRKEIKDLIAYLRLIHNEKDNDKMTDFFKENERVYIIINNENELVFCFSNPVDNKGDDHSIHFARIEKDNTKAKRATDVGFYVAKGISSLLYGSIKNSLLNAQTQNLIPLDLNELGVLANEVVKPLNDKPLAKYSQKGE